MANLTGQCVFHRRGHRERRGAVVREQADKRGPQIDADKRRFPPIETQRDLRTKSACRMA